MGGAARAWAGTYSRRLGGQAGLGLARGRRSPASENPIRAAQARSISNSPTTIGCSAGARLFCRRVHWIERSQPYRVRRHDVSEPTAEASASFSSKPAVGPGRWPLPARISSSGAHGDGRADVPSAAKRVRQLPRAGGAWPTTGPSWERTRISQPISPTFYLRKADRGDLLDDRQGARRRPSGAPGSATGGPAPQTRRGRVPNVFRSRHLPPQVGSLPVLWPVAFAQRSRGIRAASRQRGGEAAAEQIDRIRGAG